jgi:hypothetical protein
MMSPPWAPAGWRGVMMPPGAPTVLLLVPVSPVPWTTTATVPDGEFAVPVPLAEAVVPPAVAVAPPLEAEAWATPGLGWVPQLASAPVFARVPELATAPSATTGLAGPAARVAAVAAAATLVIGFICAPVWSSPSSPDCCWLLLEVLAE